MFQPELAEMLVAQHPLLAEQYQNHKDTLNMCFKRCKYNIIGMQYSPLNNLHRKHIVDKRYAKFRSASIKVLFIYNILQKKCMPNLTHESQWGKVDYILDKETHADHWNELDTDVICTNGIHFYLTLLGAICYSFAWQDSCNFMDNGKELIAPNRYQMENCTSCFGSFSSARTPTQ